MKRILLAATAAAALAAFAAPAFAQTVTTGTVVVSGDVATKCTVIAAGTPAGGGTFGSTFNTPELADTDGTLKTITAFTTDTTETNIRVNCNGATTALTLAATAMSHTTIATAPTGYARVVNYDAHADFLTINGVTTGTTTLEVLANGTSASATLSGGTRLRNADDNIVIRASNFTAPGDGILLAGHYAGLITVTITPS